MVVVVDVAATMNLEHPRWQGEFVVSCCCAKVTNPWSTLGLGEFYKFGWRFWRWKREKEVFPSFLILCRREEDEFGW